MSATAAGDESAERGAPKVLRFDPDAAALIVEIDGREVPIPLGNLEDEVAFAKVAGDYGSFLGKQAIKENRKQPADFINVSTYSSTKDVMQKTPGFAAFMSNLSRKSKVSDAADIDDEGDNGAAAAVLLSPKEVMAGNNLLHLMDPSAHNVGRSNAAFRLVSLGATDKTLRELSKDGVMPRKETIEKLQEKHVLGGFENPLLAYEYDEGLTMVCQDNNQWKFAEGRYFHTTTGFVIYFFYKKIELFHDAIVAKIATAAAPPTPAAATNPSSSGSAQPSSVSGRVSASTAKKLDSIDKIIPLEQPDLVVELCQLSPTLDEESVSYFEQMFDVGLFLKIEEYIIFIERWEKIREGENFFSCYTGDDEEASTIRRPVRKRSENSKNEASLFADPRELSAREMMPSSYINFSTLSAPYVNPGYSVGEASIGHSNQPIGCEFREHKRYVVVTQDGDPTEGMINMLLTPNRVLKKYPLLYKCKALMALIKYVPGPFHSFQNFATNMSKFYTHLITELLTLAGYSVGNISFTIAWGKHEQTHHHYNLITDSIHVSLLTKFHEHCASLLDPPDDPAEYAAILANWLVTRGPKGKLLLVFLFHQAPLDALKYHIHNHCSDPDGWIEILLWTMLFDVATGNDAYAKIKAGYITQCMAMSPYWNTLISEFCMAIELNGEGMDPDRIVEYINKYIKTDNPVIFNRKTFMRKLNTSVIGLATRDRSKVRTKYFLPDQSTGLDENKLLKARPIERGLVRNLANSLNNCGVWDDEVASGDGARKALFMSPKGTVYSDKLGSLVRDGHSNSVQYFGPFCRKYIEGLKEAERAYKLNLQGKLPVVLIEGGDDSGHASHWHQFVTAHRPSNANRSLTGEVVSQSAKKLKDIQRTWSPSSEAKARAMADAVTGKSKESKRYDRGLLYFYSINRIAANIVLDMTKIEKGKIKPTVQVMMVLIGFYLEHLSVYEQQLIDKINNEEEGDNSGEKRHLDAIRAAKSCLRVVKPKRQFVVECLLGVRNVLDPATDSVVQELILGQLEGRTFDDKDEGPRREWGSGPGKTKNAAEDNNATRKKNAKEGSADNSEIWESWRRRLLGVPRTLEDAGHVSFHKVLAEFVTKRKHLHTAHTTLIRDFFDIDEREVEFDRGASREDEMIVED